jgi:hypothetical protein
VLVWVLVALALTVTSASRAATPADPEAAYDRLAAIFQRQPHGPSFDCKLPALRAIEKRICADATLARLDLELNDAYAEDVFDSNRALAVVAEQGAWVGQRDLCPSDACLRRTYALRLATMRADEKAVIQRRATQHAPPNYVPFAAPRVLTARLAKIAGTSCFRVDAKVDAGDGRDSLLAHTCGTCSPTDHFLIFHPEGDAYRLLLRAPECYVSGLFEGFQEERSHGLRRIETFSRSSAAEHNLDFYDYDGQTYRLTTEIDELAFDGDHNVIFVTQK